MYHTDVTNVTQQHTRVLTCSRGGCLEAIQSGRARGPTDAKNLNRAKQQTESRIGARRTDLGNGERGVARHMKGETDHWCWTGNGDTMAIIAKDGKLDGETRQ